MIGASQGLIASKGLMVEEVSTEISFSEQVEAFDAQLATNRANCEGMDAVGLQLEAKIKTLEETGSIVCKDKYDDDCSDAPESNRELMKLVIELTIASSEDLQDASIALKA